MISGVEQVGDVMRRYFVCLKMEMEESRSNDKTVDHDARLVNQEVSAVLHNMLGILVSCYIIVTNQYVHEVEIPQKHEKLRIRFGWMDMGEFGESRPLMAFSIRSNGEKRASYC